MLKLVCLTKCKNKRPRIQFNVENKTVRFLSENKWGLHTKCLRTSEIGFIFFILIESGLYKVRFI